MIYSIKNLHKTLGNKVLFEGLDMKIEEGEKVALIGRNGLGKTTLFRIISGEDKDFQGEASIKKNTKLILTQQEHFFTGKDKSFSALDYILDDIPDYRKLAAELKTFEENLSDNLDEIQTYTDAVTTFSEMGYYQVEERILSTLEDFGLNFDRTLGPMQDLSGGQKRFVELARVMYSAADIALIDEPTNHMDYLGKEKFIEWVNETNLTLFIITHDRDVLKTVDRVIELKDKKISEYPGNYDAYLKQNSLKTTGGIYEYEIALKRLEKLKKQINEARVVKMKARDRSARIREENFQREYDELKDNLVKPSFWIDQDSKDQLSDTVIEKYDKYKQKNIRVVNNDRNKEHKKILLEVKNLSVGYDHPLFKSVNFRLEHGDKVFIKGRNGAGKSTLVKTIIRAIDQAMLDKITYGQSEVKEDKSGPKIFIGEIKPNDSVRLGFYEQEIKSEYLKNTLEEAAMNIFHNQGIEMNQQQIKNILGQYLFDPMNDANVLVSNLSGGQKARLQIIKMMSNNPNILILDEPTNHLDLPSIEELENSFLDYHGAIIYITHDNYLVNKLGGEVVRLD